MLVFRQLVDIFSICYNYTLQLIAFFMESYTLHSVYSRPSALNNLQQLHLQLSTWSTFLIVRKTTRGMTEADIYDHWLARALNSDLLYLISPKSDNKCGKYQVLCHMFSSTNCCRNLLEIATEFSSTVTCVKNGSRISLCIYHNCLCINTR